MPRNLIALAVVLAPAAAWAQEPPASPDAGPPAVPTSPSPATPATPSPSPSPGPTPDSAPPPPRDEKDRFGPAETVERTSLPAEPARATPPASPDETAVEDDRHSDGGVHDQELGVRLGLVSGGRVTPGGLRIGGTYLYQVDDQIWFDGAMMFTFGGGDAECFRDRQDDIICDHGRLDGFGGEVVATLRYVFPDAGHGLRPYARAGMAVRIARFSDDDLTGLGLPLVGGAGLRMRVTPTVAVGVEGQLELGIGVFGREQGLQPQAGLGVGAAVEIALP